MDGQAAIFVAGQTTVRPKRLGTLTRAASSISIYSFSTALTAPVVLQDKHDAERFAGGYVANGTLIAAALALGIVRLNGSELAPHIRSTITKMLIAEEDKLINDLEHFEFAERELRTERHGYGRVVQFSPSTALASDVQLNDHVVISDGIGCSDRTSLEALL